MNNKIKKILLLGSGGLRIGQAGEFDYSGSQAIKAIKQEKIKTILLNPNIATVQTDPGMADALYLQPLNLTTVTKIIQREKPDGIMLGFGGQTALNLGLELDKKGILKKYKIEVLGTPIKSIRLTEDRELFRNALEKIKVKTAKSYTAVTVNQAQQAAKKIGYPIMMRSGYSLGGLGSGIIYDEIQLKEHAIETLNTVPQILIEECLAGWKEIEYEIVRDCDDNALTVCNMENMDPMGIHTGESIVVAPSQTLNNQEYHLLREIAIKTVRHFGIIGECNIQYALNPQTSDYRVIEINARLSRSSALASKATGYPLAFIAAKLALGKRLNELQNNITKKTSAFFEPALDYLVVKMPRWDINKLKNASRLIGSEMKSVGEVMAIGRSFPEALQKAVRMLNIGVDGLHNYPDKIHDLKNEIAQATDRRLFAIYQYLQAGGTVEEIHDISKIDSWYLHHINSVVKSIKNLKQKTLDRQTLKQAKQIGLADKTIAQLNHTTEQKIRRQRIKHGIKPVIKQIDTLAGEFPAQTNYLYLTYHGEKHDIKPTKKPIIIIGSGPYCIGSSVEFDWCAVNTARTLRRYKKPTIIINSNPETVSTDYDESDKLYFEELTQERIQDIADFENDPAIIVSVGGQIANNLALLLQQAGYKILGTSPLAIDQAEDRQKFSSLLNELKIDQPVWQRVTNLKQAKTFAAKVGYPVIIRPSYVLSGAAMNVIDNESELTEYLRQAITISSEHPVVISQFLQNSKEIEIDGVANQGQIVIQAITEHIENAGVHSGDATIVMPPQRIYLETIRRAKRLARKITAALKITGPFNIQFLAKDNLLKIIECNLRASRSFPFVSKVCNHNFIAIATEILLGKLKPLAYETLDLDYVGVKTPQFSYQRLKGANPVAHVEMASTGEVACLGDNYPEAFFSSWLATEQEIKGKRILISIGENQKINLLNQIQELTKQNWEIYATEGTHDFLSQNGMATTCLFKISQNKEPNVRGAIINQEVDLIINIPSQTTNNLARTDGYEIRRLAIDHHIPLITNLQTAKLFLKCLTNIKIDELPVKSWQQYLNLKN